MDTSLMYEGSDERFVLFGNNDKWLIYMMQVWLKTNDDFHNNSDKM